MIKSHRSLRSCISLFRKLPCFFVVLFFLSHKKIIIFCEAMYGQCLHHIVTKKKINFYYEGIKNVHSFSYTMIEVTEIYAGQIILILMLSFNVKYLYIFHGGVTFHIVTSSLICRANQWTGFYMIRTSVITELKAIM